MTLYEIEQELLDCQCSMVVDEETGEIKEFVDEERLLELLTAKKEKIESIVKWIRNLEADQKTIDREVERLQKRKTAMKNKVLQLRSVMERALNHEGFKTPLVSVSFRQYPHTEVDEAVVPKKYLVKKVSFAPDKKLIGKLLDDGKKIKGCQRILEWKMTIK